MDSLTEAAGALMAAGVAAASAWLVGRLAVWLTAPPGYPAAPANGAEWADWWVASLVLGTLALQGTVMIGAAGTVLWLRRRGIGQWCRIVTLRMASRLPGLPCALLVRYERERDVARFMAGGRRVRRDAGLRHKLLASADPLVAMRAAAGGSLEEKRRVLLERAASVRDMRAESEMVELAEAYDRCGGRFDAELLAALAGAGGRAVRLYALRQIGRMRDRRG